MPKKRKPQWNEDPRLSAPCPECGAKLFYGQCAPCRDKKPIVRPPLDWDAPTAPSVPPTKN